MKGLFKGIKYFTNIFAYKDDHQQMVIGPPTDVRHVGHISGDGFTSMDWVNDLKVSGDLSSENYSSCRQSRETSWASQDFDEQYKDSQTNMQTSDRVQKGAPKKKKKHSSSSSSSSNGSTSNGRPPKVRPSCANPMEESQRKEDPNYVDVTVS